VINLQLFAMILSDFKVTILFIVI